MAYAKLQNISFCSPSQMNYVVICHFSLAMKLDSYIRQKSYQFKCYGLCQTTKRQLLFTKSDELRSNLPFFIGNETRLLSLRHN